MASLVQFRHRFWNNDGTPADGGKVYTYVAGTTTPVSTFTTSTGNVANTNPIILDSKGEANIWVTGYIKVNVLQSDDTQVTGWPVDNVNAPNVFIWADKGNFDASVNTYPTGGGSGVAGAILTGDLWIIDVAATAGPLNGVAVGTAVRALVNTPAQTVSNWSILEVGVAYQTVAANVAADAVATAADRVQTGLDVISTAADVVSTAADVVQTGLDAVATAADRVQTGLDVIATAADAAQTALDVIATAADVVSTGTDAATATAQAGNAATSAGNAATSESNAAASEAVALAAATALTGTSTTNLTPSLAEKIVTTQAGKSFDAGTYVEMVSDSDPTVTMYGPVTSYVGTTLTFTPTVIGTASAKADWTIAGRVGARGATGATGAAGTDGTDGLGLTAQAVGWTGTAGTTPKTLTVDDDATTSQLARRNADNTLSGTQTMSGKSIIEANASVAAHATTMNPWLGGNYVTLTGGAVTFTDMAAAPQAGASIWLYMNAAHVFTDGAVFEVDGNANYTATIGDNVEIRAKSTTVFTVHPRKADGTPVVAGSSGALIYLSTVTASAAATVDVETGFGATYDDYLIIGTDIFASGAATLQCLYKVGGTYQTSAYFYHMAHQSTSANTYSGTNGNNVAAIVVDNTLATSASGACAIRLQVFSVNSTTNEKIGFFYGFSGGAFSNINGPGVFANTGVLSGVRFLASTGNITGTFKLYGIAKA